MLYKPEVSSTVIVRVIILMIMMIMGGGCGGDETSYLETKRKTFPLKPASRFLLLLALNHLFQTANSWAEILFTPFLSNKTIICSTVFPLAHSWCVWLCPDSSAMDCLHVSLTLQDSGSAPLTLKAGEFSLCEESITSADTLLLALTSLDSRRRVRWWGDGREFEEDGEGGWRGPVE